MADRLSDLFGGSVEEDAVEEAEVQDQGSLDEPLQAVEEKDQASDVGTPELREEAQRRVIEGKNVPREPFPWEATRR